MNEYFSDPKIFPKTGFVKNGHKNQKKKKDFGEKLKPIKPNNFKNMY